ncbi:MAG: ribonuclease III [Acidimicrobiia bacterium]
MPPQSDALDLLQQTLGWKFADRDLLRTALIHRSCASEEGLDESYERLEFLGDAVLQLSVTDYLYTTYPALAEGEMAKVRAAVVNERTLATMARHLGLPDAIFLGRGEELTGGRNKDSILSDVVESLLGALYVDAGFLEARRVVLERWAPLITERAAAPGRRDFKTRLQEDLAREGIHPRYEIDEEGPEHAKRFTARVVAGGRVLGTGMGTSKKRAEQEAAEAAAALLAAGSGPVAGDGA